MTSHDILIHSLFVLWQHESITTFPWKFRTAFCIMIQGMNKESVILLNHTHVSSRPACREASDPLTHF